MDLLTKALTNLTFDDIVNFAKENHQEGVQLDYKEQFPDKDKLSQLVAAFANTRGGIIIVGIKENRDNGRPVKYEGIDDGHHDEFVAQVIGNISPIPAFEFYKTSEQDGKVFVLVRIFEGDETPYYPHNDSNIWIRTGSIKKPVEIASPEHAELLFKKAERAEIGRKRNKLLAWENYNAFLQHAERERQQELAEEKQTYENRRVQHEDGDKMDPFKSTLVQQPIGSGVAILSVLVQPFYPHGRFVRPLDIEPVIQQAEVSNTHFSFPKRAARWDSVREGMIHFNWGRHDGEVDCQQVFANGLMFSANDVLRSHPQEGKLTYLAWFVSQLYITLRGTRNILNELGYQGSLVGEMTVTGLKGVNVISALRSMFRDEESPSVFDDRSWPIGIDTRIIADESELRKYVVEFARDIHWSFGYKDLQKGITVERLEKENYFRT